MATVGSWNHLELAADEFTLRTVNFDLSNRYAPELWVKHTGKKVSKDRKLRLPAELTPVYEEYVKKYGINEIVFPYRPLHHLSR